MVIKLFEVIIEGRENGRNFSIMYHVHAGSVKQVPRIIKEAASAGKFQLVRIEETNYLHDVPTGPAGIVNIQRRSYATAV